MSKEIEIEQSWLNLLRREFDKKYFKEVRSFIREEYKNKTIYPPASLIFNSFNLTPVEDVRVVIIGQDPYHGEGQAHGLCFSVPDGIKPPPSLMNIFKELETDLGGDINKSGNLESWAKQGVLLLNSTLTVVANEANSHKNSGWQKFSDKCIELLSYNRENIVFLLWGSFAHKKTELINKNNNHLILKTVHPSPLSAYKGFFGCKHFSKTNNYLIKNGCKSIEWKVK